MAHTCSLGRWKATETSSVSSKDDWLAQIEALLAEERELARSKAADGRSVFDSMKIDLASSVLADLASYYRVLCVSKNLSDINVELDIVINAFIHAAGNCFAADESRERSSMAADRVVATRQTYRAAQLFAAENLICAIAGRIQQQMNPSSIDLEGSKEVVLAAEDQSDALLNVVKLCEKFPSHSFVRQVGRWLRDHIY
jgi:hypothetical protein